MLCSLACRGLTVGVGIVSSTFPVGLSSWLFSVHVLSGWFWPECIAVSVGIVSSTLPVVLIGLCSCGVEICVNRLAYFWSLVVVTAGMVCSAVVLIVLLLAFVNIFVRVCIFVLLVVCSGGV